MKYSDLQLDWLKCFVAVINTGSVSAAALESHRSQSAVSMQLKKLESALGCQLLLRSPRQHQLTYEGQKLLGYARRILDIHNEIQTAFHEMCIRDRSCLRCIFVLECHYHLNIQS